MAADDFGAEIYAVAAHGLLNSLTVVKTNAQLALDPHVSEIRRAELIGRLLAQVDLMTGVLEDLARGLPPDVWGRVLVGRHVGQPPDGGSGRLVG